MAFITNKPDLSANIPDLSYSGLRLLGSVTQNKIWSETTLEYGYGNNLALGLDSEFQAMFRAIFGRGSQPDSEFAFYSLTERAFSMIDSVSQLDFEQTDQESTVDLVLVSTYKPFSTTEGFFQFPGNSTREAGDKWSIGAFNSGLDLLLETAEWGGGEYANWTILHEIGHSLGLKHTHQEKQGIPALPSVGRFMDNERYSVMSYKPASEGTAYGHAVSFMALDVAALQALYGVEDYATGTSSYSLMDALGGELDLTEGDVQIGRAYYCIWDSGGEDTIDYTGSGKSVMINLNDATLNTSGVEAHLKAMMAQLKATNFFDYMSKSLKADILDQWHHAGGFFSQLLNFSARKEEFKSTDGGFSIAHNAVIENAIGGDQADLLMGNEQSNILSGLASDDTLLGSDGEDFLFGGAGVDWLDGGRGNDELTGGADRDIFVFSSRSGTDVIMDFESLDIIDLRKLDGFKNYADLHNNRMEEVGEDVVITVGSNTLVINDVTKEELTAGHFVI